MKTFTYPLKRARRNFTNYLIEGSYAHKFRDVHEGEALYWPEGQLCARFHVLRDGGDPFIRVTLYEKDELSGFEGQYVMEGYRVSEKDFSIRGPLLPLHFAIVESMRWVDKIKRQAVVS